MRNFYFKSSAYKNKYSIKGIPFRGEIGIDVSDCKSAEEAVVKAKLDYTVAKCPLAARMNALENGASREGALMPNIVNGFEFVELPAEFATYRTDRNIPLGRVKSRYEVVQNRLAFSFFDDALKEGVELDRAGYFGYGQKIFMSAKINMDIDINIKPKGGDGGSIKDSIEHYFIFTNSHDGGSAVQCMITPIRIRCMNALQSARRSADMYLSFRHNQGVNSKIMEIPELLGITKKKIEEEKLMYEVMCDNKMSDKDVQRYLAMTFLTGEEVEIIDKFDLYKNLYKKDVSAYEQSGLTKQKLGIICDTWEYYNEGIAQADLAGTAYGAYNAVTGYFSNVKNYKNEEVRLKNTVFEGDFNTSIKALNYALDSAWAW